jgi:hypothetical protein
LVPQFAGKKLESLISAETKSAIKAALSKTNMPSKKEIGLYLAELFALGNTDPAALSDTTKRNLREMLIKAGERLDAQV